VEHYAKSQGLVATAEGEMSEEQHWEMLGERLKLYGATRLAEMFRSIASSADGGSRGRSESSVLSVGDEDEDDEVDVEEDEEEEDGDDVGYHRARRGSGGGGGRASAGCETDWEDPTAAGAVEVSDRGSRLLTITGMWPLLNRLSCLDIQIGAGRCH
jgi:hypothetical protein